MRPAPPSGSPRGRGRLGYRVENGKGGAGMARLIVEREDGQGGPVMVETVRTTHLEDEHSSLQVLERLCWAVVDAESAAGDREGMGVRLGVAAR